VCAMRVAVCGCVCVQYSCRYCVCLAASHLLRLLVPCSLAVLQLCTEPHTDTGRQEAGRTTGSGLARREWGPLPASDGHGPLAFHVGRARAGDEHTVMCAFVGGTSTVWHAVAVGSSAHT
jgi:hypothetical protein